MISSNCSNEFIFQIQNFLLFVKEIYSDLPTHIPKIFEPREEIRVKDLNELDIDELLNETFTITPIYSDKRTGDTPSGPAVLVIIN